MHNVHVVVDIIIWCNSAVIGSTFTLKYSCIELLTISLESRHRQILNVIEEHLLQVRDVNKEQYSIERLILIRY